MRTPSIVAPMVILAAAAVAGSAENWPVRPMTLVVTFAAGGGDDLPRADTQPTAVGALGPIGNH